MWDSMTKEGILDELPCIIGIGFICGIIFVGFIAYTTGW